jgi:hypothetical protein
VPALSGIEDLEGGGMRNLECNPMTGIVSGLPLLCSVQVEAESFSALSKDDKFPTWLVKFSLKGG